MKWFAFLPIILGVTVGLAELVVNLLVSRGERRRLLRHAAPSRKIFRPRLIQGGKPQAPPEGEFQNEPRRA